MFSRAVFLGEFNLRVCPQFTTVEQRLIICLSGRVLRMNRPKTIRAHDDYGSQTDGRIETSKYFN